MRILKSLFLMAGLIASFATMARADQISDYVKDGVAIGGADPVAYFTENKSVIGIAEFTAGWHGVAWRFASAKNRDAFVADPARYAPQFGGFCATGMSFGKKVPIDPAKFSIVGGKLYLNNSAGAQSMFQRDVAGTIAKANTNWSTVENIPADKL